MTSHRLNEAENGSDEKLILWLNGGPGCSSLYGLMKENGPFNVSDDFFLEVLRFKHLKKIIMLTSFFFCFYYDKFSTTNILLF